MTTPYIIWSFDYYHNSGGPKVLHRLCHELNLAGQRAYVSYPLRNPAWRTPYYPGPPPRGWIAVYPEIIHGNPWRSRRVARWVLNNPGKLGGDRTYDPRETVFVFSELFNDLGLPPSRLLTLYSFETEIYYDRGLPRSGTAFYVGKGQRTRDLPGAVEITDELKSDRELLAETLNRVEILYSFDNVTGMCEIARLCGCPVVIIPNGEYSREAYEALGELDGLGWDETPPPFDVAAFRARHLARYDTFRQQLRRFIQATQP